MRTAKRFVCLLLSICMMLGFALSSGEIIRASADSDAPELPLKFDFEGEKVGEYPSGWEDHPYVVKEAPDTSPGASVIDDGGNKVLQIVTRPMPSTLNYHTHYEFQPTDSILLKYRFKLTGNSNGAYLPMPLYTGMEANAEYQCSPLSPFVVDNGQGYYNLYFGYSDYKNALAKSELYAGQWYELAMLVDLKSDTRKMYLDGELLDLSKPQSVDIYTDKTGMTMNRISIGGLFQFSTHFLVDDIEILASAKAKEVYFKQYDYNIRVNQSVALNPDFKPLGAEPCVLTYTSADPSVATVDENGMITGVKEGKTTVSVKTEAEGVAPVTLNITVDKEMTGKFTNLPDSLDIPLRGHTVLAPELTLDYEGDNSIEWESSDPEVVTIDEWGEVYALSEGQVQIVIRSVDYPTVVKKVPVTVKKAAVQQTIYVAPNGTGDGSSADAPTNLDNVLPILEGIDNSTMTGNVEVILADGYYYRTEALQLTDKHGGNNLYSVVFKAAEGAEPTIGGAMHIAGSDFKASDIEGVYVVDVPAGTYTRQLYVDNIRAIRAKEDGLLKDGSIYTNIFDQNVGLICKNTELLNCTNPDDVEIVWYNCWTHQRAGVKEIKEGEDGTVQLIMDQPSWDWANGLSIHVDFKISQVSHIENALIYLDEPGEWYLDETKNKLYYMPREFEDISKITVTVPALDVWDQNAEDGADPDATVGLVNIFGSDLDHIVQNIRFEGITFADTTWTRPSSEYGNSVNVSNYIRNGGAGDTDKVPDGAITVRRANGISFYGCVFTRLGSNGVWMTEGTKNSMVVGSHLFDIDGTAIQIGEPDYLYDVQNYNPSDVRRVIKNCDVLNNYIHNIGVDYHSANAVSIGFAVDMDISYNEIFNIPFTALNIGYGLNATAEKILRNATVSYNFIHELMLDDVNDGGAFYTNGNTTGNNKAFNNYFRNQGSDVATIYFDHSAAHWEVTNNVLDVSEVTKDAVTGRAIDWTYSAATAHHLTVSDNYYWDKDEQYFGINSTNTIQENNTRVWNGDWPEEALEIMEKAGLQEAYAGLRDNQIERLFTNLSNGVVSPRTNLRKLKLNTDDAEKKTYQVEVTATDGKDQPLDISGCVKYYIEDESIAYVEENGLVTALKAGETTLRVYVNSNNILTTMESVVVVTGETVETRPTEATEPTEATKPVGGDDSSAVDPLIWVIIAVVAVTAAAMAVILLPKKKN